MAANQALENNARMLELEQSFEPLDWSSMGHHPSYPNVVNIAIVDLISIKL
jgi:hypothetical protein